LAPARTLKGHNEGVFHVTWSPDGKWIATASRDRTVKLWDAASGRVVRTFTGHGNAVYSTAFSPDGMLLASGSGDRTVRLWDVATGREVRAFKGHDGDVYGVAFAPDGRRLASAGEDRTVRLWDVATGKGLHTLHSHTHRVYTVAFTPDGRRLASACGTATTGGTTQAGGEVKVWDVAGGQEVFSLPTQDVGVITVAFSADGKRLAGACLNQVVKVWEVASGRETLVFKGHTLDVYHVAFSPDGRRLASCSGKWNLDKGGEVKLWDLPTGRELLSFQAHPTPIWSLAFSPDGKHLATATGKLNKNDAGEVRVWGLDGLPPDRVPPPPTPRELEALWADLAGDAAPAYRAVWALRAAPRQAVPFLRAHARPPAVGVAYGRIDRLVAELDDNRFEVREQASAELERLGSAAHPALRQALRSPSLEVRRRARLLLDKKGAAPPLAVEELRALRVIEVLQHIGTDDVRPVLEKLAQGAPGAPVTRAAAASLRLLPRRTPAP
jgi:dipeptidyl aminopeptidase/acylaminoacyl peptidase